MKDMIQKNKRKWNIFLCLLPALFIYTYVVIVPIARAAYYSLYNWSGGPKMVFFGLKNYQILLKDTAFWDAFFNNIQITVL